MPYINQKKLAFFSVNGQLVASEGPRAVPLLLDFSTNIEYDIDLQNVEARSFISMIQSVFVDNSGSTQPVSIIMQNTGQTIIVAPNRQGYFTVLCPNPSRMSFISTGGIMLRIFLLNFPVTNGDWPSITGA